MTRISRAAVVAALAATALMAAGCETTPQPPPGPVVAMVNPCADLTVSIYFERDSVKLTREARAVLRGAVSQTQGCEFGAVDVYGLADSVGSPQANMAISDARAKVVTAELARLGFNVVNYKMIAAGEEGALTASGEARPLRRRADVIFRVKQAT